MANGNGLSLEGVHQELENLGSLVRNLSVQVAGVRVRVSDLEHWDSDGGLSKPKLVGKKKGKGKGKGKAKGKAKKPGKRPGKGPVKRYVKKKGRYS